MNYVTDEQWKKSLVRGGTFLDVRSPVEFSEGSIPESQNIPLLDNDQRQQVGLCYKEQGQDAAIDLGYKLVSGSDRENKIKAWRSFLENNPGSILFCFRGGKRSEITQTWLKESGIEAQRIDGGYKKIRNYLLSSIDELSPRLPFHVITGLTGSGKTEFIRSLSSDIPIVDLEKLSNHRGSSFGQEVSPQTPQATFENHLAVRLLKLQDSPKIWIEDESRTIGRNCLPDSFFRAHQNAPLYYLHASIEERSARLYREYVLDLYDQLLPKYGAQTWVELEQRHKRSLLHIKNRLGGSKTSEIESLISKAFSSNTLNDPGAHVDWITSLLTDYYDKLYNHHIEKNKHRIRFEGQAHELKIKMTSP